jgi:hypothetical protein
MNREWHQKNVMAKNATTEQRVAWHQEHARNCGCRPIPKGLLDLMTRVQGPGIERHAPKKTKLTMSSRGVR